MNFFAVMFLSSVILVLTVAVVALSAVVRKNLLDIDALQVCVLHLLTTEREEKKPMVGVFPKPFDSELYATPQRYLLGVKPEDFKDKDGNPIKNWENYMDKMWMTPTKPANTANTVINNSYNFDISGPADEDTETKIADIQALFNKMPEKEAEQLADVIKLHGDKIDGPAQQPTETNGNVTSRTVRFKGDGPIKKIVKITTKEDENDE